MNLKMKVWKLMFLFTNRVHVQAPCQFFGGVNSTMVKRNLEFIASFFVLHLSRLATYALLTNVQPNPLSPKIFLLQKPTSLAQRPDPRLPTVSCCQLKFLSTIHSYSHNYVRCIYNSLLHNVFRISEVFQLNFL